MSTNIINARKRKSLTQKRLAHEAGVDVRTLRKLEKGEEVSLETKHLVYKALGLSHEEDESQASSPPSKIEDWTGVLALAGILLCGLLVAVIFNDMESYRANTLITTSMPEPCDEQRISATAQQLTEVIGGDLRTVNKIHGTDKCEVNVHIRTKLSEPDVLTQIRSTRIQATVKWIERTKSWRPNSPDSIWE
jgi:transcriptional regulator with XRE-family HTH domain